EMIRRDYPTIEIQEEPKILDCLNALSTGEVEAFVGSLGVISYYINHMGYTNLKIAAPTMYENTKISMACTKDWVELRDIIQKVLDRIPTQEHNDIRQRWISVRYEYGISKRQLITYVLAGIGILTLIAGVFFFWNRSLRKEIVKREKVEKELSQSLKEISKQSEERKVLLQEIHHRVKNNLQIVSSMLKLQAMSNEENNTPFDLDQTIDRINAISLIHEMIYQSKEINVENIKEYLESLIGEIIKAHSSVEKIDVNIDANNAIIGFKTLVPIAIILNELVVNSLKHAFGDDGKGRIRIHVNTVKDNISIDYKDDGKWLNGGQQHGFGTFLIDIFTEQLEGSYTLETSDGTRYHFTLKQQDEQN
ncbi:MAG: transporter substrate-binding domain-containing protein, partial [Crocinitomicaceae bacterium]|nr:transporter substrate-binding domain-containing protein [Crocinitomicaceae bacterium]